MKLNALADIDETTLRFFLKFAAIFGFIVFIIMYVIFEVDLSSFFGVF